MLRIQLTMLLSLMMSYASLTVHAEEMIYSQLGDSPSIVSISLANPNETNVTEEGKDWVVATYPESLQKLVWKSEPVSLSVDIVGIPSDVHLLALEAVIDDTNIAHVVDSDLISIKTNNRTSATGSNYANITFTVQPAMLGRARLTLTVLYQNISAEDNNSEIYRQPIKTLDISVIKPKRLVDTIFQYTVYLLLVIVTFSMGAEIKLITVKEVLRRPKAPVIALCCQFLIMPLLAYAIIRLTGYRGGTALGFFAMGCAPGGGPSNIYAHLLGGDMSVSVTMTFLSTVLSIGMLPFWLYTLGTTFPSDGAKASIPYFVILQTIAVLLVPLAIGILIQYKLPKVGKIIRKGLKVLMILVVVCLFTSGIITNLYIFEMFDPMVIIIGASLPYGGFLLGGLIAFVCRMEWILIKTIAIETGLQNAGVPYFMIQAAFVSPDLELATVPVVSSILMTPVPLLIATFCYTIYNRCISKEADTDPVPGTSLEVTSDDDSSCIEEQKTMEEILPSEADESLLHKDIQKLPSNEKLSLLSPV